MLFFFVLVLLGLLNLTTASNLEGWQNFKSQHHKIYQNYVEEQTRYQIFLQNVEKINKHNERYGRALVNYKLGINQFADRTPEELQAMLNRNYAKSSPSTARTTFNYNSEVPVPDSVDWRTAGAVTPVKNQGSCGSCWSFSATGALEGQYFIKNKQLVSLSEQNLMDCSSWNSYNNDGCQGGLMDQAFEYVKDNGIMSEESYPYVEQDGDCKFNSSSVIVKISSYVDIEQDNEDALVQAVGTIGPVSVAVDASEFYFYAEGIFDDVSCDSLYLNHGILAVGYNTTTDGKPYWIVKNSWGTNWGENGYIRMAKNINQCGIASKASYPVL